MITELLPLIIGGLASVGMVIAGLTTHRRKLFAFNLTVSLLSVGQYLLLGSISAMLVGIIGAIRSGLLVAFEHKFPQINSGRMIILFSGLHILAFTIATNWSTDALTWFEWLPLAGALIGTLAPFFKSMVLMKMLYVLCGINWLTFELITGAYGQVVGEIFTLFANSTAIVYLIIQHKRLGNVPDDAIEDLGTHIIDVVTTPINVIKPLTESIPVITRSIAINHQSRTETGNIHI